MDSSELMRNDRGSCLCPSLSVQLTCCFSRPDNYRLNLQRVETLPHQITTEILQSVCRKLDLTDVTLVVPSIERMNQTIAAIPAMRKVC